jgi:hypothetical protein
MASGFRCGPEAELVKMERRPGLAIETRSPDEAKRSRFARAIWRNPGFVAQRKIPGCAIGTALRADPLALPGLR